MKPKINNHQQYFIFYHQTGQSCGTTYTTVTGSLTSINYPCNYPDNTDCSNIISVPQTTNIQIHFDDFELEINYDFLYYGIGNNPDIANAVGSFTGLTEPDDFMIQSGTVWFLFTSDFTSNFRGFSLTWMASKDSVGGTYMCISVDLFCLSHTSWLEANIREHQLSYWLHTLKSAPVLAFNEGALWDMHKWSIYIF